MTAAVQALNLGDLESDTESVNTPSTSPSHRGRNSNRDSDISFGLHSPEGLAASSSGHEALQVSVELAGLNVRLCVLKMAVICPVICSCNRYLLVIKPMNIIT